jgi:predicted nucleic-acid-binding Zn-ribbon protein
MKPSDKRCRNCGSSEFYSQEVGARGGHGPDLLPKIGGIFSNPKFHIRVCGNCGLVEWFVPPGELSVLKEKFPRDA